MGVFANPISLKQTSRFGSPVEQSPTRLRIPVMFIGSIFIDVISWVSQPGTSDFDVGFERGGSNKVEQSPTQFGPNSGDPEFDRSRRFQMVSFFFFDFVLSFSLFQNGCKLISGAQYINMHLFEIALQRYSIITCTFLKTFKKVHVSLYCNAG